MTLVRPYTLQTTVFFEGNSLLNNIANQNVAGGNYVALTAIATLVALPKTFAGHCYAIGGQTQTQINAAFSTRIQPYLRSNDIVFIWEGTNDLYVNGLSGAAAYANLITYRDAVVALGGRVVVGTVAARDYTLDPADLMTRIGDYNTLVRNNSNLFSGVCDIGANANFDARADASNTTYYLSDKIHMATAGQNLVASLISTSLASLL